MGGRIARVAALAAVAAGAVLGTASAAHADAVTEGDCFGSGHWVEAGLDEDSAEHDPGDVIEVPQADTVEWEGRVGDFAIGEDGPEREIQGEVELVLPSKTTIAIDDWGPNDSVRYANSGTHDYDLPSVLIGIKMKLQGEHRENGEVVCRGSIYVQIEGSAFENPLTVAGLAGMVLTGAGLVLAGRPKA
jgi:hypothetical protein